MPKFERNLISLGRLESKACTFKASGGALKVIRETLVLMKGIRSKRNLYELQVGCGSLGHKSDDGVVFGSKRVTFEDDKSVGLAGELMQMPKLLIMIMNLIFNRTCLSLYFGERF